MSGNSTTRPTPLAERTLLGALFSLCAMALIFAMMIIVGHWPDAVAPQRIHYLGAALVLAVLGIMTMIIAFASPWLGSVRVSGMGAEFDVNGGASVSGPMPGQIPPNDGGTP